jgi:hypothetical protein
MYSMSALEDSKYTLLYTSGLCIYNSTYVCGCAHKLLGDATSSLARSHARHIIPSDNYNAMEDIAEITKRRNTCLEIHHVVSEAHER